MKINPNDSPMEILNTALSQLQFELSPKRARGGGTVFSISSELASLFKRLNTI